MHKRNYKKFDLKNMNKDKEIKLLEENKKLSNEKEILTEMLKSMKTELKQRTSKVKKYIKQEDQHNNSQGEMVNEGDLPKINQRHFISANPSKEDL